MIGVAPQPDSDHLNRARLMTYSIRSGELFGWAVAIVRVVGLRAAGDQSRARS